MRVAVLLVLLAGTARADRYVVERGETLEHVAVRFGCSTEAVLRANHLTTTLVPPGTVVHVPRCSLPPHVRHHARARHHAAPRSDEAKARAALATIDGATWVEHPRADREPADRVEHPRAEGDPVDRRAPSPGGAESLGVPWHGRLAGGERLPRGDGYLIRRPSRAYATPFVIDHLRGAIAEVRALYPRVHTLAIGDLSDEDGGRLPGHRSHQSGLDVDVGFYFTRVPPGYPRHFAPAGPALDLEATWALLVAFARTADLDTGVQIIFLDYGVQRRLYTWARAHGTPDDELSFLLQYPRGEHAYAGLVRHWPGHTDHFHVRFKAP